ncbi:hypothetical protein [Flavilitoribacter nigricans]|uniref:SRPBCC family protein n=1 Tax=Flavilitoribacter nigricans (strain ATCC 23147 / DSM 23189 / NBRC 102662 / NCIMB 1420 / SS-2) TaxID=1122177 RepID=A0A2D0N1T3_FLAN2|nr:hypothetical protein [Flavilitoribacter nigricans]PHN02502.1 hypothetical protein CRP01_31490 [Flavilitoribacter nigricans DSM 23189 = NBRC 102662]
MKTIVEVEETFNCSLGRAFKTPILGDATRFLVGYGPVPAVEKFTDDESWGQPGGQRIPHSAKNFLSKGGEIGVDEIYVREENKYWKWGIAEFRQWSMGFTEFQGELFFRELAPGSVGVRWVYTLFSDSVPAYPFHWLFGNIFWRGQMKLAIQRMKAYAESDAPLLYE